MAYLLRSLAVIGVIAFNSPVHSGRSGDDGPVATLRAATQAASQIDVKTVVNGAAAAREAAEILAGLDPQTRERLLAATLGAGEPRRRGMTSEALAALPR